MPTAINTIKNLIVDKQQLKGALRDLMVAGEDYHKFVSNNAKHHGLEIPDELTNELLEKLIIARRILHDMLGGK